MEPMATHGKEYEADQSRALSKMMVIATSMPIAMAAIFIVSNALKGLTPSSPSSRHFLRLPW